MGKRVYKYSWRGWLISLISAIVRALASLQADLIMKDGKRNG
jgi:hypothetical protein